MDARMIGDAPTDADRYPTLTREGASILEFMRENPHAPIFRNQSGNRLTKEEVEQLRAFEKEVLSATIGWSEETTPGWLPSYIEKCQAQVPYYRRSLDLKKSFGSLPTISRADLSHNVAAFVPDQIALDRIINFRTSGTSGHPLLLPSHPLVAGSYLSFHKRALHRIGITLKNGAGQIGVILVGFQQKCFTYVSVTPTMQESGLAKINLHPNDWRDPSDRAKYLDAMNPEVYTGDPISFSELIKLPLQTRPRALLSTSMSLTPGFKKRLQEHFQCPVLDIYSMNEAGPIAVGDERLGGHVLLQNRLYVEILDDAGRQVPAGIRGEVTLTGGFNFCLPLVRYRTGDQAALKFLDGQPVLIGLEGRPPVKFLASSGEWKNNIEVTHALQSYAVPQYTLHQDKPGGFLFTYGKGTVEQNEIRSTLLKLFGHDSIINFREVDSFDGKVIQYTSEMVQE